MKALLCSLVAAAAILPAAQPASKTVRNRAPLVQTPYQPLPLGSIHPLGWLERQLRIQANGLSGHLEEFWPDLGPRSAWLGGDGEGWERGPYYLDGLIPLAYSLNDPTLIHRAQRWVDWAITSQRPDGAIGPVKNTDWWPNFVALKALTQYQEATGDPRVIPMMERYFAYMAANLDQRPLKEWAIYRWQDQVLTVLWLYNRNGDAKLLDLARKLHTQGHDWPKQFVNFRYTGKVAKEATSLETHVVNNAQGLKTAAIWYEVSNDQADLDALRNQFAQMDRYHLMPNGVHSGDEHYAGRNPIQGSELCSVVETMFSLEHIIAITGDAAYGDRLEKAAYNPLPGTFSKDMWAHQYDQQPNQVLVTVAKRNWTTNNPDSNLYGLEPNFGCCTANMHQGWPKYVASLWMATAKNGLAAVAYGPSKVTATVAGGTPVTITEQTEYPFREQVKLTISTAQPVTFPLELRIPSWAAGATVLVNGERAGHPHPGTFHTIDRAWKEGDTVELVFPMKPRVTRWFNNSVAVERGPLVFSLKIGEYWKKQKDHPQAPDWAVHPTTPWNYALIINAANPARSFRVEERPIGEYPFSPEGAPVVIEAKGRRVPEWTLINDSAGTVPQSPVQTEEAEQSITLIPYGSAKLRITAFPVVK